MASNLVMMLLARWAVLEFMGGGGGDSGPDPYEQRKQRLAQSEAEVNRIFGMEGATNDERLAQQRAEYVAANSGKKLISPQVGQPLWQPAAGLSVQPSPNFKPAAYGPANPNVESEADTYIAGLRAKGPSQFTPEWYDLRRNEMVATQTPELERQYRDRSQKESLWAWGKGLGQSTVAGKSAGALQRALEQARAKVLSDADSYVNELRGKVATARNNAIQMGGDSDPGSAARMAGQQADLLSAPAPYSAPADFFGGLVTPAAMGVQAAIQRTPQSEKSSLLSIPSFGKGVVSIG